MHNVFSMGRRYGCKNMMPRFAVAWVFFFSTHIVLAYDMTTGGTIVHVACTASGALVFSVGGEVQE